MTRFSVTPPPPQLGLVYTERGDSTGLFDNLFLGFKYFPRERQYWLLRCETSQNLYFKLQLLSLGEENRVFILFVLLLTPAPHPNFSPQLSTSPGFAKLSLAVSHERSYISIVFLGVQIAYFQSLLKPGFQKATEFSHDGSPCAV